MPRQRRIGLTGGIASGKSSVGRWLAQQQLPVLDADQYAHDALATGESAWRAVVDRYGSAVLRKGCDPTQPELNRSALGNIVFGNTHEREWLEQLMHPLICDRFQFELRRFNSQPILVLMIPLLYEAALEDLCTEVWVVHCSEEQQLQRLMTRNHLSSQAANQRIQAQWPLTRKCKKADQVIDNSGAPNAWNNQVQALLIPRP